MTTPYSASLPHVNTTAESFVSAYYSSWDNDRATLKTLYMPTSRIVWNGNPISGSSEMAQFIDKMPASKHDVRLSPLPLLRFYFASIMGGAFDSETFRTNPNLKRAYPHAIPPSLHLGAPQPNATTILVTVSGTLLLYDATEGLPAQATSSRGPPGQQRQRREGKSQNEDPDTLPRLFSHTFILVPQQGPQGQVTYAIEGETFRYVG